MEDTLGAIYDLDELRDMGLEDGEFSIDNITDEKAKRDIEMLIVIEKKL
ncbi:MAG: hypothetical protein LBC61_06960 [Candidatus Peribacteria bacterium]|jgi:hypothetical protein|nr:hypothetical protein [Candidatus Peribacteria bacterium]